jgi:hypothetical protein
VKPAVSPAVKPTSNPAVNPAVSPAVNEAQTISWLVSRAVLGRARQAVRRTRANPRYIITAAPLPLGLVYLLYFGQRSSELIGSYGNAGLSFLVGATIVLSFTRPWVSGRGPRMPLSKAEVQVLGTAPLSRASFIAYSIARTLPAVALVAGYAALVAVALGHGAGAVTVAIGVVALLVLAETLARLSETVTAVADRRGLAVGGRRAVAFAFVFGLFLTSALGVALPVDIAWWPQWLSWITSRGGLGGVSWVLGELVGVLASDELGEWGWRLATVLIAAGVAACGAVGVRAHLPELALHGSQGSAFRRGRRRPRRRGGGSFLERSLTRPGSPSAAVFWKGVAGSSRPVRGGWHWVVALLVVLVVLAISGRAVLVAVIVFTIWTMFLTLLNSAAGWFDPTAGALGREIDALEAFRRWPLSSRALVRATLLGSGAPLVALQVPTLGAAGFLALRPHVSFTSAAVVAVCVATAGAGLTYCILALRDATALTWPALHRRGEEGGDLATGARLGVSFVRYLLLGATVGVASGVGLVVVIGLLWARAPAPLPAVVSLLAAAMVFGTAAELGVRWAARQMERQDVLG